MLVGLQVHIARDIVEIPAAKLEASAVIKHPRMRWMGGKDKTEERVVSSGMSPQSSVDIGHPECSQEGTAWAQQSNKQK
jgi:hypothetical protein